jgi:hypothetical protein
MPKKMKVLIAYDGSSSADTASTVYGVPGCRT